MKYIIKSSFLFFLLSCNYKSSIKEELLKKQPLWSVQNNIDNVGFEINNLESYYYEDATIRLIDNNTYQVIYWGNRESWLWDFKKDYYFTVNLNTEQSIESNDRIILNKLLNLKK